MSTYTLGIIAAMIHLPLVIAAVVIFFRVKEDGDPRLGIALLGAVAVMGFEVVAVFLRIDELTRLNGVVIVIQDILLVLKLWVMIYVGQRLWADRGVDYWGLARFKNAGGRTVIMGLGAVGIMVAYSSLLLAATKPTAGPLLKSLEASGGAASTNNHMLTILVVTNYAIVEELIYRGCFLPMFIRWFKPSKAGEIAAIVCTTALWTIMHSGVMSSDWIKFAQVLPLGLFLCVWFKRTGFIGAAGVHLVFNLIMVPIGLHLVPN